MKILTTWKKKSKKKEHSLYNNDVIFKERMSFPNHSSGRKDRNWAKKDKRIWRSWEAFWALLTQDVPTEKVRKEISSKATGTLQVPAWQAIMKKMYILPQKDTSWLMPWLCCLNNFLCVIFESVTKYRTLYIAISFLVYRSINVRSFLIQDKKDQVYLITNTAHPFHRIYNVWFGFQYFYEPSEIQLFYFFIFFHFFMKSYSSIRRYL